MTSLIHSGSLKCLSVSSGSLPFGVLSFCMFLHTVFVDKSTLSAAGPPTFLKDTNTFSHSVRAACCPTASESESVYSRSE